jgi:hypothetical protein
MPAPNQPAIIYISEIHPVETHASSAVIHRHLLSLEKAGFAIIVIGLSAAAAKDPIPARWRQILIPTRRFYYPPYRPYAVLRQIRWHLLDQLILPALAGTPIHSVIGLLQGEYLCGYAAWLSKQLKRPLFYFYHDRGERLYHSRHPASAARLTQQNLALLASPWLRRVWTVTPELSYKSAGLDEKFRTVYPLPVFLGISAASNWRAEFTLPVIAYAGTIYNEVVAPLLQLASALEAVGGRLLLYTHMAANAGKIQAQFPHVVAYEGDINDPVRVGALLQEKASAFVVIYPDDVAQMPWSLDCFPSKFTQFVQTGLPAIVIAPTETAVGRWCQRSQWSLYSPNSTVDELRRILTHISQRESWQKAATESHAASIGDFNPNTIAQLVIDDLGPIL